MIRELLVRKNLFPIQYISTYSADFYSYYLAINKSPILDIYHDDFALADWLLTAQPQFAENTFSSHFHDHFLKIISECVSLS